MNDIRFKRLAGRLARQLSLDQCVSLASQLQSTAATRAAEASTTGGGAEKPRHCPRCGHDDILKHGRDSATGRQRYRCRRSASGGCGLTFNAVTGTPLAKLRRPDCWLPLAQAAAEQRSVHETAQIIEVAPSTVYRWQRRAQEIGNPESSNSLVGSAPHAAPSTVLFESEQAMSLALRRLLFDFRKSVLQWIERMDKQEIEAMRRAWQATAVDRGRFEQEIASRVERANLRGEHVSSQQSGVAP